MKELKRIGRPPLDASGAPSAAIHLKLKACDYDRIDRLAKQQRTSIQDLIRRGITRLIHDERGGTV